MHGFLTEVGDCSDQAKGFYANPGPTQGAILFSIRSKSLSVQEFEKMFTSRAGLAFSQNDRRKPSFV